MVKDAFDSVTVICNTAEQFLVEIDKTHDRWGQHQWIYRGQNDADWELIPALFREKAMFPVALYEIMLISDFVRYSNFNGLPLPSSSGNYTFYHKNPKVISQSGVDDPYGDRLQYDFTHPVFAIAQHSGVPTRLMDFTYDPNVAAYFACETSNLADTLGFSERAKSSYFEEIMQAWAGGREPNWILAEYSRRWDSISRRVPKELAVWAVQIDGMHFKTSLRLLDHSYTDILNLQVQKGVFVWNSDRYEWNEIPWRPFTDELAKLITDEGIFRFTLPYERLEDLRRLLSRRGYIPASMNPSYASTGRTVVEMTNAYLHRMMPELEIDQARQ